MRKISEIFVDELKRQSEVVNLIPSECPLPVFLKPYLESNLHQKYAEGYPGKRYYNGCKIIDELEEACIVNIAKNFKTKFANVQPHSGSTANQAVYKAAQRYFKDQGIDMNFAVPTLSMDLSAGGHLSHFSKPSFGWLGNKCGEFESTFYGINEHGMIDITVIAEWLKENQYGIITIGASSYPLDINYGQLSNIIEEFGKGGCYFIVFDVSHIAGLIVSGLKEHPFKYSYDNSAKVITSTTHKTFGGPRHAVICWDDETISKYINHGVFPELQGGANFAIVAALAAHSEWINENSMAYAILQTEILNNLQKLIKPLKKHIVFGLSDNHLALVRCKSKEHAQRVADTLEDSKIIVNTNSLHDGGWGIRIGSTYETLSLNKVQWEEIGLYIKYLIENID